MPPSMPPPAPAPAPAPAFALFTPFVGSSSSVSHRSSSTFQSLPTLPRAAKPSAPAARIHVTCVLDTPAANTYLQRHAEAVLRDFLTRRAVNTLMYYMHELGDGPGRNWLKQFDSFEHKVKNDKFVDADAYLDRMSRAQNEKGTLRIGHARLSRSYTFIIEPNRIAKRISNIRIQLAAEWASDLRCIEQENLEIQRLAFERVLCKDDKELNSKRNLIFDSDPFATDQTPLRYKNYTALKTLVTRHAVARLLPYTRDCGSNHEYMYLLGFMSSNGPIKDGDHFIRFLMDRPIEHRTNPQHVIQPRAIALQILELRLAIANEWISVMQYVPEEQKFRTRNILENSINLSDAPGEDVRKPKKPADDPEATLDKDSDDQAS